MRDGKVIGRALESGGVVLGAVAVLALLVALGGDRTDLRGDQEELNLIVEKRLHPEILSRDTLFGSPVADLYTPSFIRLQTMTSRWAGGDPVRALRALVWPFGVLFIVGHYVLFRSLTGSPVAAALGAISALAIRHAPGGEYWGFDGLRAIQPRSIQNALTPVLLLLFLRWREAPGFPLYFLGLGLLLNVHPVGAFHLFQVTAVGHVWLGRLRSRVWKQVAVGCVLFAIGALPIVLSVFGARENLTDPAALAEVRAGLDHRFPYLFFPIPLETTLSIAIHVALLVAATAWLLWRREVGPDLGRLLSLAVVAVLLGLGGTAIIQTIGVLTDRPYVDIIQMRAAKLAYPVLLAALAAVYARALDARSARARVALVGLFALSLVPPGAVIHAVSPDRRDAVKRGLGIGVPVGVGRVPTAPMPRALVEWARARTSPEALFLTDRGELRAGARRAITGTEKDGGWLYLGGSRPFHAWYVYIREVERCRAARGRSCWFELALRYRADYVVLDPGVAEATPAAGFTPVWAQGAWSVWRAPRVGSPSSEADEHVPEQEGVTVPDPPSLAAAVVGGRALAAPPFGPATLHDHPHATQPRESPTQVLVETRLVRSHHDEEVGLGKRR